MSNRDLNNLMHMVCLMNENAPEPPYLPETWRQRIIRLFRRLTWSDIKGGRA